MNPMRRLFPVCLFFHSLAQGQTINLSGAAPLEGQLKQQPVLRSDSFQVRFTNFEKPQLDAVLKHSTIQVRKQGATAGEAVSLADFREKNPVSATEQNEKGRNSLALQLHPIVKDLIAGDSIYFRFAGQDKTYGQIVVVKSDASGAKQTTGPEKKGPAFLQLAGAIKVDLKLPKPQAADCCSPDVLNPCDSSDDLIFNRIIYMADRNLTFYYDQAGNAYLIGVPRRARKKFDQYRFHYNSKLYKVEPTTSKNGQTDQFDFRKRIEVPAGAPLSFEVVDVNPQAYDVSITDTAYRFNTDMNQLNALSSLVPGGGLSAQGREEETGYKINDVVRLVLLRASEQLQEFFLDLQYSCLNKHNLIIQYKRAARKAIDDFFSNQLNLNKPASQSYSAYFDQYLGSEDEDSLLKATFLQYYYQLPVTYYKFITQVPAVDGSYDKLAFVFSIKGKANTPYPSIVQNKSVDAYTIGGFKVDLSTGLYCGFNMSRQQYSVRADSTIVRSSTGGDSVTNRRGTLYQEQKTGNNELGLATYLHFYPKISAGFNVSGLLGVGVNLETTPQLRYFTGIGLLFGTQNRVALNIGAAFGSVNELSDQYTRNASGGYNPVSIGEAGKDPVYKKHFEGHFFLGISYSLPFFTKGTAVQKASSGSSSASGSDASSGGGNGASSGSGAGSSFDSGSGAGSSKQKSKTSS